jgi:MFS family permease
MIESFGVDKANVAKWAGITSAVFSFTQCLTAIPWGRASDRYGRKPIVLLGFIFTMFCSLFWGFAQSLWVAILARGMSGAMNGNVGIIRTVCIPSYEIHTCH